MTNLDANSKVLELAKSMAKRSSHDSEKTDQQSQSQNVSKKTSQESSPFEIPEVTIHPTKPVATLIEDNGQVQTEIPVSEEEHKEMLGYVKSIQKLKFEELKKHYQRAQEAHVSSMKEQEASTKSVLKAIKNSKALSEATIMDKNASVMANLGIAALTLITAFGAGYAAYRGMAGETDANSDDGLL